MAGEMGFMRFLNIVEKNSKAAFIFIAAFFAVMILFLTCACDMRSDDIIVISRETGSGTRSAFAEFTGIQYDGTDRTWEYAEITNSNAVVLMSVMNCKNAIGYVSYSTLDKEILKDVRVLSIDGVECNLHNIKTGKYELKRPVIFATNNNLSEQGKDFIRYTESVQGSKVIEKSGFIPAHDDYNNYNYVNDERAQVFNAKRITIAGSTSAAPVVEALADYYESFYSDGIIDIQQIGSSAGIKSVEEQIVDIGLSSRHLTEREKRRKIKENIIAFDGIAVIVNKECKVRDLSLKELRDIFTGKLRVWEELEKTGQK